MVLSDKALFLSFGSHKKEHPVFTDKAFGKGNNNKLKKSRAKNYNVYLYFPCPSGIKLISCFVPFL